ncbi:hypothetical protein OIU84_000146 [Salix udensis]|uniref:PLD phosphodiesterase domain-containing protein n=1 Tax=Salix udensis TaxID=889485 RepID=A0AAD6L3X3_9ROSI|nr:hypothetical protein OIU84_000146 [Salix udensis]
MPHLSPVPGVLSTGDVLLWLAKNSTKNLDVIAQYWQLVASPDDPRSGDHGYSKDEMKRFGADQGSAVYNAIEDAALRNVSIRLLQHSGVYPDYTKEPTDLASGRPNVKSVTLLLSKWWGSGIIHTKVWISDRKDVYIGSANNDWKSLTQVKELTPELYLINGGKLIERFPAGHISSILKKDAGHLFLVPLRFPILQAIQHYQIHSCSIIQSRLLGAVIQIRSLNQAIYHLPLLSYHLEGSRLMSRHGIDTIKSAGTGSVVRINTMDWLGQSQYMKQTIYWSSLSSAISEVVFSKQATVKILVAYWAHFIDNTDLYLKSLLYSNVLCSSSKYNNCSGKVEIKYYLVPGYNLTGPAISNGTSTGNIYPGFTRVNHGKYAVSDTRAHIGTSNLIWDYFYTTAGVSFGTYNPAIVSQLQAIFDSDWNSPYATPVGELDEAHRSYSS